MTPRQVLLPALIAGFALAGLGWYFAPGGPAAASADLLRPAPAEAAVSEREPIRPLPVPPALDPEKIALGRRLFHDKRLSADNSIACSSCHDLKRGGVDGRPVPTGVGGLAGEVNAPSVLTAALNFRQFWDGRAATLEEQAGGPIVNVREMASSWPQVMAKLEADPDLVENFRRLYPGGLTPDNVRRAIADFERSLPRPSRFDRWLQGYADAISPQELEGYRLFKKYGCSGCHQGSNVGGNLFQRFGIIAPYFLDKAAFTKADLGRYNLTGKDEDRYIFKVPSLRNVALTAPYFHDGSVPRLADAVRIMGKYQLGIDLPAGDIDLIVAFLNSLTSESGP